MLIVPGDTTVLETDNRVVPFIGTTLSCTMDVGYDKRSAASGSQVSSAITGYCSIKALSLNAPRPTTFGSAAAIALKHNA